MFNQKFCFMDSEGQGELPKYEITASLIEKIIDFSNELKCFRHQESQLRKETASSFN